MRIRLTRFNFLACVLFLCNLPAAAETSDRWALVIGNASYPDIDRRLYNSINDATDMAKVLERLGFEVTLEIDLGTRAMREEIGKFRDRIPEGSLALFYYAGHGAQIDKRSHLLPIGATESQDDDALSVDFVLSQMDRSQSAVNILVFDACRNPLRSLRSSGQSGIDPVPDRRSITRGVRGDGHEVMPTPPKGTLVAYATASENVANDGAPGGNGIFTRALLEELAKPGLEINRVLLNARVSVVNQTRGMQFPWIQSNLIGPPIVLHRPDPKMCLEPLKSYEPGTRRHGLGRALQNKELVEPVLISGESEHVRATVCEGRSSLESVYDELETERFESALVAWLTHEGRKELTLYEEIGGAGFYKNGSVRVTNPNSEAPLLEARRQDNQYDDAWYVEIVATDAIGAVREDETVLIVATRDALRGMQPTVWEESWGDRAQDSWIGREIIWWELEGAGQMRIHPAVSSFAELPQRLRAQSATIASRPWREILADTAPGVLSRAIYALVVADQPEHVSLAEELLRLGKESNRKKDLKSETLKLDIAKLEAQTRKTKWDIEDLWNLENSASLGRFWLLGRYLDLAALMPERVAGVIRFANRKKQRARGIGLPIRKDLLVLANKSQDLTLANAFFLDQIPMLSDTAQFLGCLSENEYDQKKLPDVLVQGLELLGLLDEFWLKKATNHETFRRLFQGLDLSADVLAPDASFLSTLQNDPGQIQHTTQKLNDFLTTIQTQAKGDCGIGLIPDSAWQEGRKTIEVRHFETPPKVQRSSFERRYQKALAAQREVRAILKNLIHVKGALHTRRKMDKGYRVFDEGEENLRLGYLDKDKDRILVATTKFKEATEIFNKAYEQAFRVEHDKPKVRVH